MDLPLVDHSSSVSDSQSIDSEEYNLKIMTYNVEQDQPGAPWSSREPIVIQRMAEDPKDFYGLQETKPNQADPRGNAVVNQLRDDLNKQPQVTSEGRQYAYITPDPDDPNHDAENSIFYDKNKWHLDSQGQYFINQDKWDKRYVLYGVFSPIVNGKVDASKKIIVCNTHASNVTPLDEKQEKAISDFIYGLREQVAGGQDPKTVPTFFTGDFNVDMKDQPDLAGQDIVNARDNAGHKGDVGPSHDGETIDRIYSGGNVDWKDSSVNVIRENSGSDHQPVEADIHFHFGDGEHALIPSGAGHATVGDPATDRIDKLNQLLANPSISPQDKIAYTRELYTILSGNPDAIAKYGPISGPITPKSPDGLPSTATGTSVPADQTAWKKSDTGYLPTNDWFEQMAAYPGNTQATNNTGYYSMWWDNDHGGMTFKVPVAFHDIEDPNNPAHGYIAQDLDSGFSIGADGSDNKPVVSWEPGQTGNLLRDISYNQGGFVIHAAQGSLFQSATYIGMTPNLHVPAGGTMTSSDLPDGTKKYRIETGGRVYFVYGSSSLDLKYDAASGKLTSDKPYTGSINMTSLAKGDQEAKNEQLLDAHANAVIVKAQGSVLPGNHYEYSYVCQDLSGKPTATDPLILLKRHQSDDLVANGQATKEDLTETGLTGKMQVYAGTSFSFDVPDPKASLDPLPGPGLTKSQAQSLIDNGSLDKALADMTAFDPGPSVYNKGVYQQGLTLNYAQKVLEEAGWSKEQIAQKLDPLYKKMQHSMDEIWGNLERDTSWGTTVAKSNDYGQHSELNDHIVQYGYPLYALTLMKKYEDAYVPADQRYLSKESVIHGYTNKDMGDILASDMGETGKSANPENRNFDVFNGHSWLSGIGKSLGAGNDTESESEAVFGSMSVAAWLDATQPGSEQAQMAKTRWAMETQAYHTYFQVDPKTSVYNDVSPDFVKNHPVVSMLWEGKVCDETWWGLNWDRIIACETMPASANLMDNFLNGASPEYRKQLSDYIVSHWSDYDNDNNIQSVLIPIVAKVDPAKAQELIKDVEARNAKDHKDHFDTGTNAFIQSVIALYASNEHAA